MSKGERRGNRETKKPKQEKPKVAALATTSLVAAIAKAPASKKK